MLLNSVNTNVGALTALRQLGGTEKELAVTRGRVSTGLRVASAKDDAATWAVAQRSRGDVRAMNVVLSGLQRVQSVTDVAIASGEVVSGLLIQMREKALAASDAGVSDEVRSALDRDFQQLKTQMTRAVESATFGGQNLINGSISDYQVLAGIQTVDSVTLVPKANNGNQNNNGNNGNSGNQNNQAPKWKEVIGSGASMLDVITQNLSLAGQNVVLAADAKLTVAADVAAVVTNVDASIRNVSSALIRLGAASNAFQSQQTFLRKLQDAATAGVGNLVDADLPKESARLQALQTRQQLGVQALGIANRAPSVLTQLFRV